MDGRTDTPQSFFVKSFCFVRFKVYGDDITLEMDKEARNDTNTTFAVLCSLYLAPWNVMCCAGLCWWGIILRLKKLVISVVVLAL